MPIRQKALSALLALAACLPLLTAPGAAFAQRTAAVVAAPRISGFDVEQAKALVPGTELDFTLYGTPGGVATIGIEGATGRFLLEEVEPGVYEGIYTIRQRDRIVAGATVTANLRLGNQVASAILDESLVTGAASRTERAATAAAASALPKIDRFDVEPAGQLVAGEDLMFTLDGTPGGKASVRIAGVKGKFFLEETRQGRYQGTYLIKSKDRIAADGAVTANLRVGERNATAVLGQSLVASANTPGARNRRADRNKVCANCGMVEAVNVINVKGEGSYLGMIAGGIAGGLLGTQVGSGRGKTVAEVAGAVGGAVAGNEAEKYIKTTKQYEVVVRLQGGGTQSVSFPAQPAFKVGDKVRVEGGTLVANR
jgi:outer membrane lipoprotein SlyB